jgi:hypothetical protein
MSNVHSAEIQALETSLATLQFSPLHFPTDGVSVTRFSPSLALRKDAFVSGLARVGVILGLDYFKRDEHGNETGNMVKARLLWETLRRNGWTEEDFIFRCNDFCESVKFPNWTIADFLGNSEPTKLHPYSWVQQEQAKDAGAMHRMEAYKIEGLEKPLWRYASNDGKPITGLERVVFRGASVVPHPTVTTQGEPSTAVKNSIDEKEGIAFFASKAAKAEKLVEELQEKLARKEAECSRLREQLLESWSEEETKREEEI